jgi:hypothetical protein
MTMQEAAEIDELKKAHEGLYKQMMSDRQSHPEKFQEESYRSALVSEARALVGQLGDRARAVDLLDDYTWLANAVLQWQIAFSSVLEEPLRQEIPDPQRA